MHSSRSSVSLALMVVVAGCGKSSPPERAAAAGSPPAPSAVPAEQRTAPPAAVVADAAPAAAPNPEALVIRPRSVGPFRLGMTQAEAMAAAKSSGLPFEIRGNLILFGPPAENGGVNVSTDAKVGVFNIGIYDASYQTPEGVHLGMSAQAVGAIYGKPTQHGVSCDENETTEVQFAPGYWMEFEGCDGWKSVRKHGGALVGIRIRSEE